MRKPLKDCPYVGNVPTRSNVKFAEREGHKMDTTQDSTEGSTTFTVG